MNTQNKIDIFNFQNGDIYVGKFNINLTTHNIYRHGDIFFVYEYCMYYSNLIILLFIVLFRLWSVYKKKWNSL